MLIVFIGYLSGLIHKLWWQEKLDGVVWLYLVNALMVVVDGVLYYRNSRFDKRAADHGHGTPCP